MRLSGIDQNVSDSDHEHWLIWSTFDELESYEIKIERGYGL